MLLGAAVLAAIAVFAWLHLTELQELRSIGPMVGAGLTNLFRGSAERDSYTPLPKTPALLRIAAAYRPHLYFDTGERLRPLAIDDWMQREDGIRVCLAGDCDDVESAADLFDAPVSRRAIDAGRGTELRLDIPGDEAGDFEPPEGLECGEALSRFECDGAPRSAIYFNPTWSVSRERLFIDYWWFLRFNDYGLPTGCSAKLLCVDHEGDWEGITVVVTPTPNGGHLLEAHYAQHSGLPSRFSVSRLGGDGALDGVHPVVYVARGTHASYTRPCPIYTGSTMTPCTQSANVARPEAPHDGAIAWYFNSDERCNDRCVLPLDERWATWPGRWGSQGPAEAEGPLSPGMQDRFAHPELAR